MTNPQRCRIYPTPSQAAECGGPCYEPLYCPEACNCGVYDPRPPETALQDPVVQLRQVIENEINESFRAGSFAVLDSLDERLRDWRVQFLIRFAPRWTLQQIKGRMELEFD